MSLGNFSLVRATKQVEANVVLAYAIDRDPEMRRPRRNHGAA